MRGGRGGGRGRGFGRGGNSFIQNFLRDNVDDRNANDLEDAPPQLYNIYSLNNDHTYINNSRLLVFYFYIDIPQFLSLRQLSLKMKIYSSFK